MAIDSTLSTYSAQDIDLYYNIAGIAPVHIQSLADGDAIKITRNVDLATMRVGIQGAAGISISANKSGTVTVSILQDSETDFLLTKLLNLQTTAGSTLQFGTLTLRNLKSGTLGTGQGCYFQKQPDYTITGDNYPTREWIFLCASLSLL